MMKKIDEFKIEQLENETELIEKTQIVETIYDEFDIKWADSVYDILAKKRCVRGVSLIREPSRDMGNLKFQPAHCDLITRSLKFLEDLEEMLFMKDYVLVEDDLYI